MGVSGPRSSPSGTGPPGSPRRSSMSSPETKSAQRPKGAASSMRVRTSSSALPRSIRPRETRTSAHVCDAKERPCSRRRHGRRGGPAHRPTWPRATEGSVPTSIASELLRGPGFPLGSRPDLDVDRLERLDVASPDQGDDGASAEIGRSRPHRHTPPSEDRWRSGTAPTSSLSSVRMRPSDRGCSSRTEGHRGRRRSDGPG
jgi:hypothetical protein